MRDRLANVTINDNIQQSWDGFKKAVNDSCFSQLGRVSQNRNEDFISSETWKLISDREKLKNEINSTRNPTERKQAQDRFNALDKRVRRATREDKKDHINSMARAVEDAEAVYNMKELHDITRKKAVVTADRSLPVKHKGGRLLTFSGDAQSTT